MGSSENLHVVDFSEIWSFGLWKFFPKFSFQGHASMWKNLNFHLEKGRKQNVFSPCDLKEGLWK